MQKILNVKAAKLVNYQKICDLQAWSSALLIKPSNFLPEIKDRIFYTNFAKVFATRGVIKMQNITPSVIFLYKFSTHEKNRYTIFEITGKNFGGGEKKTRKKIAYLVTSAPCNNVHDGVCWGVWVEVQPCSHKFRHCAYTWVHRSDKTVEMLYREESDS